MLPSPLAVTQMSDFSSSSFTSLVVLPPRVRTALSEAQQRSLVFRFSLLPSFASSRHERYVRLMDPALYSQPSPIHEAWLLVAEVRPSTPCEL